MKSTTYPLYLRWVHWASVILLLLGVLAVLMREELEGKPIKRLLLNTHQTVGLAILLLLAMRILLRLRYQRQLPRHDLPVLIRVMASASHLVLYLCLLVTPLVGWAYVSAKGKPPELFGLWALPALIAEDMDWAETLSDWHVWLAYSFLAVIAGHMLAAFWHHLVRKDGVLRSMWSK